MKHNQMKHFERIRKDHAARTAAFSKARCDADDDQGTWRTLENGVHIHINE